MAIRFDELRRTLALPADLLEIVGKRPELHVIRSFIWRCVGFYLYAYHIDDALGSNLLAAPTSSGAMNGNSNADLESRIQATIGRLDSAVRARWSEDDIVRSRELYYAGTLVPRTYMECVLQQGAIDVLRASLLREELRSLVETLQRIEFVIKEIALVNACQSIDRLASSVIADAGPAVSEHGEWPAFADYCDLPDYIGHKLHQADTVSLRSFAFHCARYAILDMTDYDQEPANLLAHGTSTAKTGGFQQAEAKTAELLQAYMKRYELNEPTSTSWISRGIRPVLALKCLAACFKTPIERAVVLTVAPLTNLLHKRHYDPFVEELYLIAEAIFQPVAGLE